MSDPRRTGRRTMWAGFGLAVLGVVVDARWHEANPDALEAGWALLEAHGVLYAGMLVILAGAVLAARDATGRWSPTGAYGFALAGALAQVVGRGWDAAAHSLGGEAAIAHAVSRTGLLVLLAALAVASWQARGAGEG